MPSFYVFSLVCFLYSAVAFLGLLSNKHTAPQITPPTTKEPTVTPNPTAVTAWWTELSAVPDNTWVFTRLRHQRVARVVISDSQPANRPRGAPKERIKSVLVRRFGAADHPPA